MKTIFVLMLAAGPLLAADPVSDALQKGLFEEEANHNLDAAIKAYQSVIDQTAEQRKLTATAVFRLGECYRKLNKTNEAVGQYQRVVRVCPEHATLAKLSDQNLTALGVRTPKTDRPQVVAPFQPEDSETKEINRLKALAKDSPDLLNAKDDQGDTPLLTAAGRGHVKVAEFLLANKAEVNAANSKRTMPLHYAVFNGRKEMVELLLTNGADVSAFGSVGGDSGDKVTPYWCQPLHMAVYRGNQATTELLLNCKAEVNGTDYRGRTPLHFAVDQGFLGLVRLLLSKGADLNVADERGRTPAAVAALSGYEHILRLLIENGADVSEQDKEGNTLAHYTALQRTPGVLKTVLDRKPDLEIQNNTQQTPLLGAVRSSSEEAVELLLQAGADPNARDGMGLSPLMAAVDRGNKDVVRLLLAHKADPNLTNLEGMTALNRAVVRNLDSNFSSAQKKQLREIADILRQAGAKDTTAQVPFIGIARGEDKLVNAQYIRQDAKGLNRLTLFDLIHTVYSGRGPFEGSTVDVSSFKFPDFAKIRINRAGNGDKGREKIELNIAQALSSGDCTANVPLEWGDIVEIPEADHQLNEAWSGLSTNVKQTLTQCLAREVTIHLKGDSRGVTLRPGFWSSGGQLFAPAPTQALHFFRLKNVLTASGQLRASSDLKRVDVVRKMPDTGERLRMTFNVEGPPSPDDLILRQGDEIYVPEKGSFSYSDGRALR
jgi:ankyrin repeat protein